MKGVREAAGLTQIEFAGKLGVHPISLSRFERDVEPITVVVELAVCELARRLGVEHVLPGLAVQHKKSGARKRVSKFG